MISKKCGHDWPRYIYGDLYIPVDVHIGSVFSCCFLQVMLLLLNIKLGLPCVPTDVIIVEAVEFEEEKPKTILKHK